MDVADPLWIPFRLRREPSETVVDWCEGLPAVHAHPMFDTSIHEHLGRGARCRTTPVSAVQARAGFAPAGLIYHVSRCGSTLLSNMLNAIDGAISLAEPMLVSAVLRDDSLGEGIAADVVSALVASFAGKRVVIKLTASAIAHRGKLDVRMPDVPRLFLYRDPIEVVVSLVGAYPEVLPPGVLEGGLLPVAATGEATLPAMKPAEFWARVVGWHMRTAIDAYRTESNAWLLVHYSELPGAVAERVAPRFGLHPSAEDIRRMQAVAMRSAKAQHRTFIADVELKQREASEAIRRAVGEHAREPYMELERLRLEAATRTSAA